MAELNEVRLRGSVSILTAKPAADGKMAFVKGSIRLGKGGSFPVMAFGKPADDFGNARDLTVTVVGRLGWDKPFKKKDGTETPWTLYVIALEVAEQAPRGAAVDKAEGQEEDGAPF